MYNKTIKGLYYIDVYSECPSEQQKKVRELMPLWHLSVT